MQTKHDTVTITYVYKQHGIIAITNVCKLNMKQLQ